ncbi:hypothetical protein [Streptomyces sp. NPDC048172]|uniref:hypothetical protein n=1 Tax=Streptomyces sp. NPDC048172 TaxID=3365505 RepID=UPI0037183E19
MNPSTSEAIDRSGSCGHPHGHSRGHALRHRWPAVVGALAAVSSFLTGADRTTVGIVVAIAATCYFSAAALGRPWVAWAAIPGGSVLIVAGGVLGAGPLVTLGVVAAILTVVALALGVSRTPVTVEAAGLLAYGGLVALGFALAPTAGLVLVAVTLVAHAAWDVAHLRRGGAVVPRSLSEFCVVLDVLLGAAILAELVLF